MTAMLVVLGIGCSGPSGGGPDAGAADGGDDGGEAGDGGPGTGGLTFAFTTSPALPQIGPRVSVTEVRMTLRDVRAIGDAAPGDARTSVAEWQLEWREGQDAASLAFPLAPPGIYSTFAARIGGGDTQVELRGSVRLTSGATVSFRVEDDGMAGQIAVSLEGLTVDATPRVATIVLSLAFLEDLDWDALAGGEQEIQIDSESPAIAAVRAGIVGGFSLAGLR